MGTLMGPGALGMPLYGVGVTKTEDGMAFPKAAFGYTPDDVPTHWKLRLWETPQKKVTARQVGMAVAALGKGFRGQKVAIPARELGTVKRRVLRAWHEANPGDNAVPAVLKVSADEDGVAPPGWKKTVEKMKQHKDIDNPFAIAWWLKNRGAHPSKHEHDMDASADTLLTHLIRQQHQIPALCLEAARGASWAQARLLAADCPLLLVEGRY